MAEQELMDRDHVDKAIDVTPAISKDLTSILSSQHAIHGIVGRVYERCGGEDFMYEYAQENPRWFLTMFINLTPPQAPTVGMTGDINLTINNHMTRTALDD